MSPRRKRKQGSCIARTLRLLLILAAFACLVAVVTTCRSRMPNSFYAQPPNSTAPNESQSKEESSQSPRHEPKDEQTSPSTTTPKPEVTEQTPEKPAVTEDTGATTASPSAPVRPGTAPAIKYPTPLGREFSRGSTSSKQIALTFDAGADASPTPKILDALAKHGVHATFFLTGVWAKKNPSLVRRIAAEGHEIGNHTWDHKSLTDLSDGKIEEEAETTDNLIQELTGKSTKPLLRVPFGARDKHVLSVLEANGYRSIYWDIDSWDSVKAGITSDEIEARVLGRVRDGSIILMHCGSKATADALDSMLDKLTSDGYEPVTIGQLLDL